MFQRVGVLEQATVVQEQVQCEVQRLREGGAGGRAGEHGQHRQVGSWQNYREISWTPFLYKCI